MKHYKIGKAANGYWKGEVITKTGATASYNFFFDRAEAEIWCYAKVRYNYGRQTADAEFN